jgi:hypothetical protein
MDHGMRSYWTHRSPVLTVGDMVTRVVNPETRHRRGSSGFRRIAIALFLCGPATLCAVHFLCERNADVDR